MDLSGTWESQSVRLKEARANSMPKRSRANLMDRQAVGSVHSKEKDKGNLVSVMLKGMSLKGLTIICN